LCYRLAVATGLRYSEIKSLTPASFGGTSVTVQAAYSKNGQTATLDLPPDVASDLTVWVQGKPKAKPVFPLPGRGSAMLRVDLEDPPHTPGGGGLERGATLGATSDFGEAYNLLSNKDLQECERGIMTRVSGVRVPRPRLVTDSDTSCQSPPQATTYDV